MRMSRRGFLAGLLSASAMRPVAPMLSVSPTMPRAFMVGPIRTYASFSGFSDIRPGMLTRRASEWMLMDFGELAWSDE